MRFWGKDAEKDSSERSVARAALDGATREVWLQVALKTLAKAGNADRIGVWMEASPNSSRDYDAFGFHGVVWDRENGEMPAEWANLSAETVLPEDLRNGGKIVREDLQALPTRPIIGPLIELRSALWIPIARNERLKGVILAGSRGEGASLFHKRLPNQWRRNWRWQRSWNKRRESAACKQRTLALPGTHSEHMPMKRTRCLRFW